MAQQQRIAGDEPEQILGDEGNLARRIAAERAQRGWSLAELSRRVEEVGHPIERGQLNRLERGERPFRVAQLIALAKAFRLRVEDLLTPVELVAQRDAEQIANEVMDAMISIHNTAHELGVAVAKLRELHESDEEAGEYLLRHLKARLDREQMPTWPEPWAEQAMEGADAAVDAVWWAIYEGAELRFGHWWARYGLGGVPDPDMPMWRDPREG